MNDILTSDKKDCPKCGSKNVTWTGVSGITRFGELEKSRPSDHHTFKCNECETRFEYYGKLD